MLGSKCYSLGDQVTYDLTELTVAINVASVTASPSASTLWRREPKDRANPDGGEPNHLVDRDWAKLKGFSFLQLEILILYS